jgi:hypothetical protein
VPLVSAARRKLMAETFGVGLTFLEHINAKPEYEVMDIDNLEDPYTFWLTAAGISTPSPGIVIPPAG